MLELRIMSVEIRGKEYRVKKKKGLLTLNLSQKGITDMLEIKGLEKLTDLEALNLRYNKITEIKGIDSLTQLKILNISQNRIKKISGVDTLKNLDVLILRNNDIKIIEGLDNLSSLKDLDLWENNVTQINSHKILRQLSRFIISGNPIYNEILYFTGKTKSEKLNTFILESDEKREEIIREIKHKEILAQKSKVEEIPQINIGKLIGYLFLIAGIIFIGFIAFAIYMVRFV